MAKDARDIDARRAENGKLKERYGEIRMGAQMAAERSMRRMAKEWSDALLAKKKTGNGTGTGSVSVRKKLDFRWIRAALGADGARSPPKGFGRAKSVEDVRSSPEDHDAVQKITKDVVDQATMQTVNRHSTTGDSALSVDSTILTSKTSTTSEHDPQGCSNEEKQRVINDGGASGSGPNLLDFIAGATLPNSSLSRKDSKMDDFTMHSGNAMEETSIKDGHSGSRLLRSHSSLKKILQSNVSPAKGFTSSRPSKIQKQIKRDRTHGSNQKSDNGCWWLKLPYLLVICLHGKSNGRSYEGLYILKMDPQSNATLSYIVAFEDRGDAINFCCILRPFFKGLDLSADIVPMTGKELKEGVKSAKLNVIAVRKGQLHMYAGKSLLEVENSLRSILDESVSKKD